MKPWVLIAWIGIGGCNNAVSGGANDGGASDDAPIMALDDFCAQWRQALAARLHDCLGGATEVWASCFGQPASACRVNSRVPLVDLCRRLKDSVAGGRTRFDPAAAAGCVQDTATIACSAVVSTVVPVDVGDTPKCAAALHGLGMARVQCAVDEDCDPGFFCELPGGGGCNGGCSERVAVGLNCAGLACVHGATCRDNGSGQRCVKSPDPSSLESPQGGDCAMHDCQSGLACDRQSLQCQPLAHEGQPCQPGHGLCEPFTACGAGGTCVRVGGAGMACGAQAGGDARDCLPGSACDSSTGTCLALKPGGAPCMTAASCRSGSCVNRGTMSTCATECP